MTAEEMIALIHETPPGPWPEGWRGWPCVCEAHRIMFRREAERIAALTDPGIEWHESKGIVICGGGIKYYPGVWVLCHVLRDLGCQLPIQVWHLGTPEMDPSMVRLLAPLGVECVDAFEVAKRYPARILCGFEVKIYASYYAPFQQVLFLDADNLPARDPTEIFDWPEYEKHGAVFWPDYACWKLKADVWHIWGMTDILEDVIHDTAFESGQYLIDKRRCWRELLLSKWLADHSDYTFGTVYGDKECFHLAWRRLGRDYAMPPHPPGWGGNCCIIQHDFRSRPIFYHRCQDKWRLDGRNRKTGLPYEQRAMELLRELRQQWAGVPWRNKSPSPEEQAIIAQLEGQRVMYHRVGYDRRPLVLDRDQRITEGAGDCERRWDVHIIDGVPVLTISSYEGPTCHLRRDEDGVWRGQWLHHEKMPIEVVPLQAFAAASEELLEWAREVPTPQEREWEQRLEGQRYLYVRLGYDQRPIMLGPAGRITEGAAGLEQQWRVRYVGREPVLTITDGREPTCHLRRDPNGLWRGQWLKHERMPILLRPLGTQDMATTREGESAPAPPASGEESSEEDEDTEIDIEIDLASQITIVIVSFLRFACLAELLRSIRAHYPQLRVIVADQSGPEAERDALAQWCRQHPQVEWLPLPYDCGLSAARNAAVARVQTPYVWLMDDDFLVLPTTDVMGAFRLFREVSRAELVAGPLYDLASGMMSDWAGMMTISPTSPPTVRAVAPGRWRRAKHGTLWRPVGRFLNSFLARTDLLRRVRWRDEVKISGEHRLFLADLAAAGVRCLETPALTMGHQAQRVPDAQYAALRARRQWFETSAYYFAHMGSIRNEPAPRPALHHPCRGIVVLTPGHTGSRVVARLLDALGWAMPEMDRIYAEPVELRAINQRFMHGAQVPLRELRQMVWQWPRPWCVKDPRLCETLDHWLPAMTDDAPLLLVVERDMEAVRASWQRRGEPLPLLDQRWRQVEKHWEYWPWERRRVSFEAILGAWDRLTEPAGSRP